MKRKRTEQARLLRLLLKPLLPHQEPRLDWTGNRWLEAGMASFSAPQQHEKSSQGVQAPPVVCMYTASLHLHIIYRP